MRSTLKRRLERLERAQAARSKAQGVDDPRDLLLERIDTMARRMGWEPEAEAEADPEGVESIKRLLLGRIHDARQT